MPKEAVYGVQHVYDPSDKNPKVPIVEVRWSREAGYIQVVSKATSADDGRVAGPSTEAHVTDGYHVDLNRDSINSLIRNLRRARDQAFGRDE